MLGKNSIMQVTKDRLGKWETGFSYTAFSYSFSKWYHFIRQTKRTLFFFFYTKRVLMREGSKPLLLGGWKSDLRTLMQRAVHHFTYSTSACTGESENHPPHNAISYLSGLPGSQAPENSSKTLFGRDILPRQHQWELCQDTVLQLMLKRFLSIIWRHYAARTVLLMGIKS